MYKKETGRR